MVALVLALLTAGDSFYTALYFHARFEAVLAFVLGALLFQAPLVLWFQLGPA